MEVTVLSAFVRGALRPIVLALVLLTSGLAASADTSDAGLRLWKLQEGNPDEPRAILLIHGVISNAQASWGDFSARWHPVAKIFEYDGRALDNPGMWIPNFPVPDRRAGFVGEYPNFGWYQGVTQEDRLDPKSPVWTPSWPGKGAARNPDDRAFNPEVDADLILDNWALRQRYAIYTYQYDAGLGSLKMAPEIARDLEGALREIPEGTRLTVVGHSHGGVVARELALRISRESTPKRPIEAVVYVGSPLDGRRVFWILSDFLDLGIRPVRDGLVDGLESVGDIVGDVNLDSLKVDLGEGFYYLSRLGYNHHASAHGGFTSFTEGNPKTWREVFDPLDEVRRASQGKLMRQNVVYGLAPDHEPRVDRAESARNLSFLQNIGYSTMRWGQYEMASKAPGDGVVRETSALGLINGPHPPGIRNGSLWTGGSLGWVAHLGDPMAGCPHFAEEGVGAARLLKGVVHTELTGQVEFLDFLRDEVLDPEGAHRMEHEQRVLSLIDVYNEYLGRNPDLYGLHHYMWDSQFRGAEGHWNVALVVQAVLRSQERRELVRDLYEGSQLTLEEVDEIAHSGKSLAAIRSEAAQAPRIPSPSEGS